MLGAHLAPAIAELEIQARTFMQVLVPARFLTLMGHWIALLTLVLDRV
jgi:hypothetical protein